MKNLLGKVRKIKNVADENELVTDYMFTYYGAPDNHMCTLCGQRGIIDTRGVKTPAGVEVGRLNWCLCPNGQAMREQAGDRLPADFPEYTQLMLTDSVENRVIGNLNGKAVVLDAVLGAIMGKAIKISWGPEIGRPAGYYVSVPSLGSVEVVKLSDLRKAVEDFKL